MAISSAAVANALDGITAGQNIVSSVENVALIDNRYTNTILAAPTMRQFVMACANIDALTTKVNDLFGLLAGIAFTDAKPASLGLSANWSTPAIPTHTITVGTMTDVTMSKDSISYDAGDEITTNEGKCTVTLTPASGKAIADTAIHIQLNGNDIPFTRSGNNVTFVLSGDVTISAIAAGGINIDTTALTGVNVDKVSALINTAEIITLSLPPHHQWSGNGYQDVVVKYGTAENTADDITNSCVITSQNNGNIEVQLPPNLNDTTKTIYISGVTAEENAKLTFTWDAAMTATKNGEPANSGFTVYSDEVSVQNPCVVKFTPAVGKKWAENGTPSATGQTFTQDGNSYKLEISSVPTTANVTVSATVEVVPMHTVTLPSTGNGIKSVELQDDNGNTIDPVEGEYSIPEGDGISVVIEPDTFYRLSVDSENSSMEDAPSDWYSSVNNNDTLSITIDSVTGDVVIAVNTTNYNVPYKNVMQFTDNTSAGKYTNYVFAGEDFPVAMTRLIDLGENRTESITVVWHTGATQHCLSAYDSNGVCVGAWSSTASEKSSSVSTAYRYIALSMPLNSVSSCYIKVGTEYLFNGSTFDVTEFHSYTEFMETPWWPKADENGVYNNAMLWSDNQDRALIYTKQSNMFYYGAAQAKRTIVQVAPASRGKTNRIQLEWSVTREYNYDNSKPLVLCCGGNYSGSFNFSNQLPYVHLRNSTSTVDDYFAINNTKTLSEQTKYKSSSLASMVFKTADYDSAYIVQDGVYMFGNDPNQSNAE